MKRFLTIVILFFVIFVFDTKIFGDSIYNLYDKYVNDHKTKIVSNEHIRRVSIDNFYKEVTGIENAFFQICEQLPITIEQIVSENDYSITSRSLVLKEIKNISPNILVAFYKLAFGTYIGFDVLSN